MKLLTRGNPKTLKGEKKGYLTFILHLAPSRLSGYNVCPNASTGCRVSCLNTAGRGGMFKGHFSSAFTPEQNYALVESGNLVNEIQAARIHRTVMLFENRDEFLAPLKKDIEHGIEYAEKHSLTPVFRLNGTSDYRWETTGILGLFPTVQFYDYTKLTNRTVPDNYHLTFSLSESNLQDALQMLAQGVNVAVVFRKPSLPTTWNGYKVVNGDESDLRFLDPKSVVVGLKAKGQARHDKTGFVQEA